MIYSDRVLVDRPEVERVVREHFKARDEARGIWGKRLIVKRTLVDLSVNGLVYEFRHRGEVVTAELGSYMAYIYRGEYQRGETDGRS